MLKLCAKHNICVTYTGPQTKVFNDLFGKYRAIYENEVKEHHSRDSIRHDEEIKKRKHDTIIMKVPTASVKQYTYVYEFGNVLRTIHLLKIRGDFVYRRFLRCGPVSESLTRIISEILETWRASLE